jgi:PII-like signaling protein
MTDRPAGLQASYRAKRLTVYLQYADRARRRPVYFEILKRARRARLAGLTTFQGDVGYGQSGRLHHAHLLRQDSPLSIVIVDRADQIDAFVADIGDLLAESFMVVADVDVIET